MCVMGHYVPLYLMSLGILNFLGIMMSFTMYILIIFTKSQRCLPFIARSHSSVLNNFSKLCSSTILTLWFSLVVRPIIGAT